MVVQCLPPGMQHREKPDVCAQVVRIACHSQEGLGHGLKVAMLNELSRESRE
jgi:hypothetical protein